MKGCGKRFLIKVKESNDEKNQYWNCGDFCIICEDEDYHYCKECVKARGVKE